jgi:mono/diheme cytochrome c family protein
VWISFVAGMGFVTVWLVEGLNGAPRRFSVLPEEWSGYQIASIPFIFVLALVQLLFAYNIVQTLRGKAGLLSEPAVVLSSRERRRRLSTAGYEGALVLVVVGLVIAAGVGGYSIGNAGDGGTAPPPAETGVTEPPATTGGGAAAGDPAAGEEVFASAGCGSCHTFAPAGSSGAVGPSLDETALDEAQIADVVTNGRGAMPSFSGQLDEQQIRDVAAFVAGG